MKNANQGTIGVIMPISKIQDCNEQHWKNVLNFIKQCCRELNYQCNLVSESKSTVVIHSKIIQSIKESDIIICDISCYNPNVMFELGIRLSLGKPTIIIKDNLTDYIFDISPIQHLTYPRFLPFGNITTTFKKTLQERILQNHSLAISRNHFDFLSLNYVPKELHDDQNKMSTKLKLVLEQESIANSI